MALFVPNPDFADDYLKSDEARQLLETAVPMVEQAVRGLAPVRSGDYRNGIESVVGRDDNGEWLGRVNAMHWSSHWVEAGTGPPSNLAVFAPLRRGAESVLGPVKGDS
ncbi:MAG: hypothetical protein P1T08_12785 [Acidimicrobiia bacterium]|nr:hypothetical protein [Acidimicrobiia bacterium]